MYVLKVKTSSGGGVQLTHTHTNTHTHKHTHTHTRARASAHNNNNNNTHNKHYMLYRCTFWKSKPAAVVACSGGSAPTKSRSAAVTNPTRLLLIYIYIYLSSMSIKRNNFKTQKMKK